ncbi:hypothetical protein [Borreliella mayonii]|uniref:hypothetical protein n=1 Tax=Borreliella mayonii TaxID=1674146 RepID=UPI000AD41932|nr:hypothetical protein [Borreliella mayonii]
MLELNTEASPNQKEGLNQEANSNQEENPNKNTGNIMLNNLKNLIEQAYVDNEKYEKSWKKNLKTNMKYQLLKS